MPERTPEPALDAAELKKPEEESITVAGVAALLGINHRTVRQRIASGRLPRPDLAGWPTRWRLETIRQLEITDSTDPLVDAASFAKTLGLSEKTLSRRVKAGIIPRPERKGAGKLDQRWRRSTVERVRREFNADPLLDWKGVSGMLNISRKTLEEGVRMGRYPKPDSRSGFGGGHLWRTSTISRFIATEASDPFLPARTVAQRLGISVSTLRRRHAAGQAPAPDRRAGGQAGGDQWRRSTVERMLPRKKGPSGR